MMQTGQEARYSRVAMALHWLIAAAFALQIGLGLRMDASADPSRFAVYQLHKSLGITILLLTLVRIAWRFTRPAPAFPETLSRWERGLARLVHAGFYVLLLALPLTGWLLVSSSSTAIPTVLYGTLPWPHLPGVPGLDPGAKEAVNEAAETTHAALAYIAYLLIALHVAGALKHQFVDRGGELGRMLPLARRQLAYAAVIVPALLLGILLVGNRLPFAPPKQAAAAGAAPATAVAPDQQQLPGPAKPTEPAEPPAEPVANVTDAEPGEEKAEVATWIPRKASSSVAFHTKWSQGDVDGRFTAWNATIRFSPDDLAGSSVDASIDLASVRTGVPDTEGALPGAEWFSASLHPRARFVSRRFRHRGGDRYEAAGTLTLKGASKPFTLRFTLSIKDDVARMKGSGAIDRTAFGVGEGEWASTDDVPANVGISVAIIADRQP